MLRTHAIIADEAESEIVAFQRSQTKLNNFIIAYSNQLSVSLHYLHSLNTD